jgi:septum formation topological specificity factor MinE
MNDEKESATNQKKLILIFAKKRTTVRYLSSLLNDIVANFERHSTVNLDNL